MSTNDTPAASGDFNPEVEALRQEERLSTPDTPQWAVEAAKEIEQAMNDFVFRWKPHMRDVDFAAIIARHAPQPTAPTAQPDEHSGNNIPNSLKDVGTSAIDDPCRVPVESGPATAHVNGPAATGTPRTDCIVSGNSDPSQDEYEDLATFARQLETELAEARAERDTYKAAQKACEDCMSPTDAALRAELTALRGLLERGAKMRPILRGLLASAKAEADDVLTDPTWNHDYLFGFKLTVKDLRSIDRYLATERKEDV